MGTINLLECLKNINNDCFAVFITSDKVYDNKEWVWGYREFDEIGGPDPYSASKGCAELAISSYYRSFFKDSQNIKIGIARAGNVIGGGDWAEDRIIPDCIRSWSENKKVILRNPNSTRPWQHVLEPLSGYLKLAASLCDSTVCSGEAFNFGPFDEQNRSVLELVNRLKEHFIDVEFIIENRLNKKQKESKLLKLNCDKALSELDWLPRLSFNKTVEYTANWYLKYVQNKEEIINFTKSQILNYENINN